MYSNSANHVVLVGHLGKAAEVRHTSNDKVLASFSLATNFRVRNEKGEFDDRTDWHRVVCWGNLADYVKTLVKGQQLYVEGRLTYREWTDNENKKHSVAEIMADTITPLGARKKSDTPINEEDVPF